MKGLGTRACESMSGGGANSVPCLDDKIVEMAFFILAAMEVLVRF